MLNNPCSNAMVSLIQRQATFLVEAERERLLRSAEPVREALPRQERRGYRDGWRAIAAYLNLSRPLGQVDLAR